MIGAITGFALRLDHTLTSLLPRLLRGTRFRAKRVVVEREKVLHAPPDQVFPLLCPTREYEWIENWKCDLIYSQSGYAESDCIFINRLGTYETWMFTRYEPERFLFEVAVFTSHALLRIELSLADNENGTTTIKWRCTVTSSDRLGSWFVEKQAGKQLGRKIEKLFAQLDHYLLTGKRLTRKRAS